MKRNSVAENPRNPFNIAERNRENMALLKNLTLVFQKSPKRLLTPSICRGKSDAQRNEDLMKVNHVNGILINKIYQISQVIVPRSVICVA